MIALEGLRDAVMRLEYELQDLLTCQREFAHNWEIILDNLWNSKEPWQEELSLQRKRVDRLNRICQYQEGKLNEERDFLELYCQQYAFAGDMVSACADIMTCRETEFYYRWNYWDGGVEEVPFFVTSSYSY